VIKRAAELTPMKIVVARERVQQVTERVEELQRCLKFYEDTPDVKDRKMHLKAVKKALEVAQADACAIEVMRTIGELSGVVREISQWSDRLRTTATDTATDTGLATDIQLMVLDTFDYFGVAIKPERLESLAYRIVVKFGGLTLEDVAVCLSRAQNGDYGKVFGELTPAVVMTWLTDYEKAVRELLATRAQNRHLAVKPVDTRNRQDYTSLPMNEEMMNKSRELARKYGAD
jgi:hypothetical protein